MSYILIMGKPLDISLEICVPHQRQFHLKLRFDRAEVDTK